MRKTALKPVKMIASVAAMGCVLLFVAIPAYQDHNLRTTMSEVVLAGK